MYGNIPCQSIRRTTSRNCRNRFLPPIPRLRSASPDPESSSRTSRAHPSQAPFGLSKQGLAITCPATRTAAPAIARIAWLRDTPTASQCASQLRFHRDGPWDSSLAECITVPRDCELVANGIHHNCDLLPGLS